MVTSKARRTQTSTHALWIRVLSIFIALLIVGSTLVALFYL